MGQAASSMNWSAWRLNHRLLGLLVPVTLSELSLGAAGVRSADTETVHGKIVFQDGKLTAHVKETPLRRVMDEISRLSGARVRWLGPVTEESVSVQFASTPLPRALKLILGEKNFLLLYASAKKDSRLTQIWISPAHPGIAQLPPTSLVRVNASLLRELQRAALRRQNLSARFQAIEQLKRYAQTDSRAKIALFRIARGADTLFIRQAAVRALASTKPLPR